MNTNSMQSSTDKLKEALVKTWTGIRYVWDRPIVFSGILLVVAILFLSLIVRQSFKAYFNCNFLLSTSLGMPKEFCTGVTVVPNEVVSGVNSFTSALGLGNVAPSNAVSTPNLSNVMDPGLEKVRTFVTWIIILLFAFLSLYLTIILNHLKSVVKFLTLNKEEWKRFLSSVRIWLLVFVVFCASFYFIIVR